MKMTGSLSGCASAEPERNNNMERALLHRGLTGLQGTCPRGTH